MYQKYTVEERCRKILEDYGGVIADKAKRILLEDPILKDLKHPLEFISKSWRDPLTPAIMSLSCEAVGGQQDETHEAALAMSLMNLSFYIWDDIIDKAPIKFFKQTLSGKFGEGVALIVGGLASAKAFSIINQMKVDDAKSQTINKLFWDLWTRMAQAETSNLKLRCNEKLTARKKLWKIKTEAVDMETCMRIGATIGNGSQSEVEHLARYGHCLAIILELWKDFLVSTNLTAELEEKIRKGAMPYSLLWACEHSEEIAREIRYLTNEKVILQFNARQLVSGILETKVLDNVIKNIQRIEKKGKLELTEIKTNDAVETLHLFIELQPQFFLNSLSALQANDL
jgi:geranylgeranyl pyrophosphate synthase